MLSLLLTLSAISIVYGVDFTGCINVGQAGGNKTLDAATDDKITSADGRVRFLATTGTDGGCIETMEVGETVWRVRWCISYPTVSSGTLGDTVVLEANGNLTYYNGATRLWSSNSAISGGYNGVTSLCVSDCGNIAVKRNDNGESLYDVGYDVLYTNSAPFAYPDNNDPACAPSNTPTTAPTNNPTAPTPGLFYDFYQVVSIFCEYIKINQT